MIKGGLSVWWILVLLSEYESLVPGAHSSIHNESSSESMETVKVTDVNRMRRKLRFFFMNPIEKWQARRRFPYKFLLQVFKILLVTTQVSLSLTKATEQF